MILTKVYLHWDLGQAMVHIFTKERETRSVKSISLIKSTFIIIPEQFWEEERESKISVDRITLYSVERIRGTCLKKNFKF